MAHNKQGHWTKRAGSLRHSCVATPRLLAALYLSFPIFTCTFLATFSDKIHMHKANILTTLKDHTQVLQISVLLFCLTVNFFPYEAEALQKSVNAPSFVQTAVTFSTVLSWCLFSSAQTIIHNNQFHHDISVHAYDVWSCSPPLPILAYLPLTTILFPGRSLHSYYCCVAAIRYHNLGNLEKRVYLDWIVPGPSWWGRCGG